jgi:uncharacterized protein YecE (DUF72 family)
MTIEKRQSKNHLVGTYGFGFSEWAKVFYPRGVPQRERLRYYATIFPVVEMVHTFRYPPKSADVARWCELTPEDFSITAKAPQFLTEGIARLNPTDEAAASGLAERIETFAAVLRPLGPRLGPVVLQMDPKFERDKGLPAIAALFGALLGSNGTAKPPARFAMEFRHPSWFETDETAALLRAHGVTWIWNDMVPAPGEEPKEVPPRAIADPRARAVTTDDLVYVRLSGSHEGKDTHDTDAVDRGEELQRWAELVKQFTGEKTGRRAYVLVSDHYAGKGPATARFLQSLLE